MRQEIVLVESQRAVIEMTLHDLDRAQEEYSEFCRRGGIATITPGAAQTAVIIHKAKVVMALNLFGWDDTDQLRAALNIATTETSVYVHRRIC